MNQSKVDRPRSEAPARLPCVALVPEPSFVPPPPEDRHAAVCAGAIKYLPELHAFARSLASSRHQADDLVQSTILRALRAAEQFTPGTNFKAWSFTILRNVFYNQWRSPESRNIPIDASGVAEPAIGASQERSLELCDFRRAFAELVPEQREALILIGASGLGYEAAAAICGCATGTMKSRVWRARRTLKALMDGGALQLRRSDVAPVSGMDPALAVQFSRPPEHHRVAAE